MSNAFMASAEKSKREQEKIRNRGNRGSAGGNEELKAISIRIPADLHHKASLHRLETGESTTQLIIRLLKKELN
ncbi:hypothetical protein BHK98_09195 [Hornefia porci]|uniref:Uncharacterized protein n=1 Tax=Hornefia porci TaxID=2652292 RepID=A0A1Q9JJ41_9FIRM|nr:hypothetical protein [Hornefia porci]OLR56223.1 hypothetical protein BHK98_09195 [Hornefia porci]